MRGERCVASFAVRAQRNVEPIGGQLIFQPLRPFDQAGGFCECVFQAELPGIVGPLQPIKIDMPEFALRAFIGLHQCISWAGRFFRLTGPGFDGAAGERGFAGAKIAAKANNVARLEHCT